MEVDGWVDLHVNTNVPKYIVALTMHCTLRIIVGNPQKKKHALTEATVQRKQHRAQII
jgi:hypothetical protein